MFKNVASQKWTVLAFNSSTGARVAGDAANITAKVAKDDGVATALGDVNPTEVEDGKYRFDLTQAETNADKLELFAESATSDVVVIGLPEVVYTRPQYFPDFNIASDGDFAGNVDGTVAVCTTNTDMRGTDNAALASVLGGLADAAADGDPTATDTVVAYVKQLINTLVGSAGIPTFPASAVPANAVSLAEVMRQVYDEVAGLDGAAMRGTDGANTTTPPTAAAIADAVLDEALAGHTGAGSAGERIGRIPNAAAGANGGLPTVDANNRLAGIVGTKNTLDDLNDVSAADVNAQVDAALDTPVPVSPTADSINERVKAIDDKLPAGSIGDATASKQTDIEGDTQDIQSRLPAALVSGRMSSDAVSISGSTDAADRLEASAETIVTGAAVSGTLSTTQMTTDLLEATDDHYNGRILVWTSGVLKDQATDVTNYVGATKMLEYTAVTESPSPGDGFNLV